MRERGGWGGGQIPKPVSVIGGNLKPDQSFITSRGREGYVV